jgi:nickel/cobalt transporter (NicO) family protein
MDFILGIIMAIPKISLLVMISAFVLGALHALEPGHGKSVMAALGSLPTLITVYGIY